MFSNEDDQEVVASDEMSFEVQLDDDTVETIHAIDHIWVEEREYGRFRSLPLDHFSTLREDDWISDMDRVLQGLNCLRSMKHHIFWSTILNDEEPLKMIDSYLKHCPRLTHADLYKRHFHGEATRVKERMVNLHKSVLMVLIRMLIQRESRSFLSPEYFHQVLLEKNLFTIPRMLDICALYGLENGPLLNPTFKRLFDIEPSFISRMSTDVHVLSTLFDKAGAEAERLWTDHTGQIRFRTGDGMPKSSNVLTKSLIDFCDYCLDVAFSLMVFSKTVPNALTEFYEGGLASIIPPFVEKVSVSLINGLFEQLSCIGFLFDLRKLMGQVELFRLFMIRLFGRLLDSNCKFQESDSKSRAKSASHDYLRLITAAIKCENFIFMYNVNNRLETELELLFQKKLCTEMQMNNLLQRMDEINAEQMDRILAKLKRKGLLKKLGVFNGNAELISKVDEIRDIMPDRSPEFVHLCLRHFNYDTRLVLDSMLNPEKMPTDMRHLFRLKVPLRAVSPVHEPVDNEHHGERNEDVRYDFDAYSCNLLDLSTPHPSPSESPNSIGNSLQSIVQIEPDEFNLNRLNTDLLNLNQVETSPITPTSELVYSSCVDPVVVPLQRGKKHEPGSLNQKDLIEMRPFYERFDTLDDQYNDEYDDTYDGLGVVDPIEERGAEAIVSRFEQVRLNEQVPLVEEMDAKPRNRRNQPKKEQQSLEDPHSSGTFTGRRSRQLKETHKGKSRKHQSMLKTSKGMF